MEESVQHSTSPFPTCIYHQSRSALLRTWFNIFKIICEPSCSPRCLLCFQNPAELHCLYVSKPCKQYEVINTVIWTPIESVWFLPITFVVQTAKDATGSHVALSSALPMGVLSPNPCSSCATELVMFNCQTPSGRWRQGCSCLQTHSLIINHPPPLPSSTSHSEVNEVHPSLYVSFINVNVNYKKTPNISLATSQPSCQLRPISKTHTHELYELYLLPELVPLKSVEVLK